jgi:long-chain acyl-CoA synthetase
VDILEGYGLTETTAASAVNPPEWNKIGTVGQPWPGTEFRVADDGELLIRGPGVFQGYWQNDAATADVLDDDSWFHTGDLGAIDDDGFVAITGRKKEIIVTAGGKNVAPAILEERLKAHRLISQVMVVGDQKPFVGALITLDPDELETFAREHRLGDAKEAAQSEQVRSEVDRAVAEANTAVSRAESIRKTAILERDFTIEDGELTPTLKVRRMVVADHFAAAIDELYAG